MFTDSFEKNAGMVSSMKKMFKDLSNKMSYREIKNSVDQFKRFRQKGKELPKQVFPKKVEVKK